MTLMTNQFKMTTDRRSYVPLSDGGGVHYMGGERISATWTFPEGSVTMATLHDKYYTGGRGRGYSDHVKSTKARVYVWASESFNVVEDLTNRRRRPHDAWRPVVEELLHRVGVEFDKMRWNQRAGCSCGCSPGFILEGGPSKVEFFVHLNDAPTVDETKPGRDLVTS
jgi:hypothetical protein